MFPIYLLGRSRISNVITMQLSSKCIFTSKSLFSLNSSHWHPKIRRKFQEKTGKIPRRTDIDGKPANENEIHWKTKQRIMDECFKYRNDHDTVHKPITISAEVSCSSTGPFWTCRNTTTVKNWVSNWSAEETEWNMRDIGRLDVALLYENYKLEYESTQLPIIIEEEKMEKFISEFDEADQDFAKKIYSAVKDFVNDTSKQEFHFTKKLTSANRRIIHALADRMKIRHISQGKGTERWICLKKPTSPKKFDIEGLVAIEVFVTAPMSDDKVNKLNKANVPWIEIRGSPSFYRQGTKQWNINKPLKAIRSSHRRDDIEAMKNPNLRENPWICDDCVSQVQSKLSFDKLLTVIDFYYPPEENKGGRVRRYAFPLLKKLDNNNAYYLTETSIVSDLNIKRIDYGHELLGSVETPNSDEALQYLKNILMKRIKELSKKAIYIDKKIDWPGKQPKETFTSDDILNFRDLSSPSMLYPSLSRLYPYKYDWSYQHSSWKTQKELYSHF